ncbi:hypothetical protein BKA58DRAFT_157233 [Alternaria rosae]|uniref:uncharacterized protein n=1 Tax=Alternaria rosae TaxID=1187941 RepID=UPI001E8ED64F|nr:uncharacterized protein BKA58DRAFT_157233 [Alternaria rosae]KAH6872945.1 hypothetical protein BKA58DRAFT_157233 [Alternaria rosae]
MGAFRKGRPRSVQIALIAGGHDVWASYPRRRERNITKLMTKSMYTSNCGLGVALCMLIVAQVPAEPLMLALVSCLLSKSGHDGMIDPSHLRQTASGPLATSPLRRLLTPPNRMPASTSINRSLHQSAVGLVVCYRLPIVHSQMKEAGITGSNPVRRIAFFLPLLYRRWGCFCRGCRVGMIIW